MQEPEARARLIPRLYRWYAFDPFPLLVDDRETEGTKLAVIRGLHLFASRYGYSLSALEHDRDTLRYVGQADESAEVRAAALKRLQRIDGKVLPRKSW